MISQPLVAISATPDVEANAPSSAPSARRRRARTGGTGRRLPSGAALAAVRRQAWRRHAVQSGALADGSAGRFRRWVARATISGRWATTRTQRSRPSSSRVSRMTDSVSASRCAVGSSSTTTGRSATHDAGQGEPGALPGREGGAVLGDRRVESAEAAHVLGEVDPLQRRPELASSAATGRASSRLSRTVPEKIHGRWGTTATWSRHQSRSTSVEGDASHGDRARCRGQVAGQHRQQRRLAGTGRAGDRGDPGGGEGRASLRTSTARSRPG